MAFINATLFLFVLNKSFGKLPTSACMSGKTTKRQQQKSKNLILMLNMSFPWSDDAYKVFFKFQKRPHCGIVDKAAYIFNIIITIPKFDLSCRVKNVCRHQSEYKKIDLVFIYKDT